MLLVCLLSSDVWAPLVPQGGLLLYTIIRRPYKKLSESIRSGVNLLVMCGISSMRVYFFYADSEIKREFTNYYVCLGILMGLLMIIIWAYVVVIKDFVEKYYLEQKRKKDIVFNLFE